MATPSEVWSKFDRSLYDRKLLEPSLRMHSETQSRWRRVSFEQRKLGQGEGPGFYASLVDSAISVLREYLEAVDRIGREVWRAQEETETPEFVRAVRDNAVFPTIAARCDAIRWDIELMAARTHFTQLTPVLHHLARERGHLESIMSNRYEIEARELGYKNAPTTGFLAGPQGRPKVFIEDAVGGSPWGKTPESDVSYSKFRTKRLQKLSDKTEARLRYLNDKFPDWRIRGGGLGNEPSPVYTEARQLEKDRERILLELSKRAKRETRTASAKPQRGTALRESSAKAPDLKKTAPPQPESINRIRAKTVAKVIEELNTLKPQMFSKGEYEGLRAEFPGYVTFEITEKRSDLKEKLAHIQDHRRHIRFAQEIAAAYHLREVATVQKDWKRHKPKRFRRGAKIGESEGQA